MSQLNITLCQLNLQWENPSKNLQQIDQLLASELTEPTDLIVLPEMFTSGFSMDNRKLAEHMSGATVSWMQQTAINHNCAVAGSIPVLVDGKANNNNIVNRLVFTTASSIEYYDKKHLFSMAGEHKRYQAGKVQKIVSWRDWRINLQVCYDLRFPAWSRNTNKADGYDLLLYVANWPEKRRNHWRQLLIARAIENQTYVVGVNRVGTDGNGIDYSGDTLLVDYLGELAVDLKAKAQLYQYTVDKVAQQNYQKKFPALADADSFTLLDK